MKKFCSTCGNQLELSQRLCTKCGTVNPFFVATFSFLSDQSDELEKLRFEKERIEKELAEKEEKQQEFIRQEQLKKEAEEAEILKLEKSEKEKQIKANLEVEKEQMSIKKEIMKRVKEESDQYKTETSSWMKEVKEELKQIEEDNKRLREEVASLSKLKQEAKTEVPNQAVLEKSSKEKRLAVSLIVILICLTSVLAFFYFTTKHSNEQTEIPLESKQEVMLEPINSDPIVVDTTLATDTATIAVDTFLTKEKELANNVLAKTESKAPASTEIKPVKVHDEFVLNEAKIKRDMVGKRISGCDIIINSSSEIENVASLVLVEKVASGNKKYKFTVSISQGGETYTASPYIYYNSVGGFIKIDGTTCE